MSGLLERIVRRARASASSQLDTGTRNGAASTNGHPYPDGSAPADAHATSNGAPLERLVWPPAARDPSPAAQTSEAVEAHATVADQATVEAEIVLADDLEPEPPSPGLLSRGRVRRRVRYLRRLREVQLRDLGGFVVELQRLGRDRPELVREKVAGALRTDIELRTLAGSLGSEEPLREIRQAGIGGACEHCGAIHGSTDRFCASCGAPLTR
jgi:hypothetical protein